MATLSDEFVMFSRRSRTLEITQFHTAHRLVMELLSLTDTSCLFNVQGGDKFIVSSGGSVMCACLLILGVGLLLGEHGGWFIEAIIRFHLENVHSGGLGEGTLVW